MAVRVLHDIDNLPDSWQALLEKAAKQSFFCGQNWFSTLADRTLDVQTKPHIYGVETSEGVPLMVMMMQTPSSGDGSVLRNTSKRQGSLSSLTNFHSCEFYPAIGDTVDPAVPMRELALYLRKESPGWSFIEISALDRNTIFFKIAVDAFRQAGFLVGTKFNFGNWYERFENNSFAEYLKKKTPAARKVFQNYSRLHRKLERFGEVGFKLFKDEQDIERAIGDFQIILKLSWKKNQHLDFVSEVFRNAAQTQKLRMGILYFNEEPVAAEVGVLSGGRATMIQTVYDNNLKKYSVGSIVTKLVIEHLLNIDKVAEIDFGRDDQYYKKLWLAERRERWAIVAFNPFCQRAIPLMIAFWGRVLIDRMAEWARPWTKPLLHKLRLKD